MMISSRRLTQMAKKWLRKAAAGRRKRIAFDGGATAMAPESDAYTSTAPARKGCFAVYSDDKRRFEVELAYLKSDLFAELLRLSEDVFGLPGAGPITLPCDAAIMDSVISCLRWRSSEDAGRALLSFLALHQHCSTYINPCSLTNQQLVACGC